MVTPLNPREPPRSPLTLGVLQGPAPRGSSPPCAPLPLPWRVCVCVEGGGGATARPAHAGRRRRREGGAVTWPDDGFQQGDPSSQDLQPGLLPQEGLEATGLGESERAEQSARSPPPRGRHGWHGTGGTGGVARRGWRSVGAALAGRGCRCDGGVAGGGARSPRRVLLLLSEGCRGLPWWPQGDAKGSPIPVGPGGAGGPLR